MANTFTTNYGLTKSEIGANNDNWGTDLNNALSSVDTQINRKVDKADIVTQTSNKIAFSGSTITANSTTASTIFENFKAGDVISIAGAVTANNGNHTISSKTNAYTLVTSSSFQTEAEGDNTISYHLVPKYSEVDIDGGTIDGATIATSDITVGSGKTLNVSSGTITTSTAQKDAIVDGSTAISRSGNDLTFAGNINASSGTANNIGTVTAGTINNTVTQDGVVRLIKVVNITGSEYQNGTGSNEFVGHDPFSISVVSGRTYLIQTDFALRISDADNDDNVTARVKLYADATNRNQSDNAGTTVSNPIYAYGASYGLNWIDIEYHSEGPDDNLVTVPVSMMGAFTAGSTETRYVYFTHSLQNGADKAYPRYETNRTKQVYFVFEVTGVSVTSHSTST